MKIEEGKARKPWRCDFKGCKKKIEKGQAYYLWHLKGEAQRQHQDHGEPAVKPTAKRTTKAMTKKTTKKIGQKRTKGGK